MSVMSYDEQNRTSEVNGALNIYAKDRGNISIKLSFLDFSQDIMLIIQAIRRGISYFIFNQIKLYTPFLIPIGGTFGFLKIITSILR